MSWLWHSRMYVIVLDRSMESQTFSLVDWIPNSNTYINKDLKNLPRFSSTQKDNIHVLSLHQMNDNLDFSSTIAKLMNARGHKV
jgi:hypothetical protein